MAKAREIPGLDGREPFTEAARRIVAVRAEEVWEQAADVLDTDDIERVHDMRVATRRLRAVLEIFAAAFPRKAHRAVLRDVKRLADALGERRDPDVAIEELEGIAAHLSKADQAGVRTLVDALRTDQERGNVTLAAELRRVEEIDLRGRLRALAGRSSEVLS